mgnify:CR=1 FL=1
MKKNCMSGVFLAEFVSELRDQLEKDEERWGDTWRQRDVGGQEKRIYAKFQEYYDQWEHGGNPIPWRKVAGLALIGWIRENHTEVLYEQEEA